MASFRYLGKVRGQGRPRFTRNGHAYESKADREYKKAIRAAFIDSNPEFEPISGPVSVVIEVARNLPKSKRRAKSLIIEQDTQRPDVDNIAKSVLDALNGVAYLDDSQVVRLAVCKYPRSTRDSEEDSMQVTVRECYS